MDHASPKQQDSSLHLQISELKRLSDGYTQSATIFEPSSGSNNREGSGFEAKTAADRSVDIHNVPAPEKRLTLFALRLAVLEKSATGLGTLGFIWATVVLLGGFAITLDKSDFWVITIILLTESARIFSRSHELEWQRQSTWSLTETGFSSFRLLKLGSNKIWSTVRSVFRRPILNRRRINASRGERELKWDKRRQQTRRWASSDVPILPYAWFFQTRNISKILQFLQILAAVACVILSTMKLIMHNFGNVAKGDSDKRNRKSALFIFYGLALAEASLFLLEKIYWELNAMYCKVLEKVNEECEFGPSGMVSVRRFFYDAYSRCVEGSVFDGLKMDMVSFAMELLGSNSPDEQLMGARILRSFAMSSRFSDDTLQKLGTSFAAVERLLEILNWNHPGEEEMRQSAAEILSKLAGKKQNSLRVAVIPGALESISSLLYVNKSSTRSAIDEVSEKSIVADDEQYGFWTFNHLGLLILKKLARDHDNCGKIGNTRGLLPKIINFTCAGERLLKDDHAATSQIQTVKRSLQVIKMLASTTGSTGNQLRKEISENVFTFSNIRDILKHGEKHPDLQKLGIEILTSLAMEDDATQILGATGGIIKELLNIFFKEGMPIDQVHVRTAAGEALVMLALESRQNSNCILKLGTIQKLVTALQVPLVRLNAARILRNLCTYSAEDCFLELRGVAAAVPTVLKGIISEDDKLREVMVGLAARACKFMTYSESSIMFEQAGITETEIATVLVQILKKHTYPNAKFPRIRRFTIELATWMMRDKQSNVGIFRELGLEKELQNVIDTTSEIESFNIFSGTVGLSRFRTSMHSLAETALNLLSN
ncbi:Cellulose synthase-like protein D4 [Bienertia sinuspersici]